MIYRVPGSWNILCCFSLGIYLDLGWSVASTGDIRKAWIWADACWLLLPCKGSLSDVGLLSECVWALSTVCLATSAVPILFPGVWERASGCGDPQQGFFPRAAWMVKLTKSGEISCFVFHKPQWLLITKTTHTRTHTHTHVCVHTHAPKQKHIHKTRCSLPSLYWSPRQSLTICVTFTHGSGFPHYDN